MSIHPAVTISRVLIDSVRHAAVAAGALKPAQAQRWMQRLIEATGAHSALDRVPASALSDLWRLIASAADDHSVGARMAAHAALDSFGIVGEVVARAESLDAALDRCVRFAPIVRQGIEISVLRQRGEVILEFRSRVASAPRNPPDAVEQRARAAGLLWIMSNLAGIPLRAFGVVVAPLRAELACPRPRDEEAVWRNFRCPVDYGAGANRIVWPQAEARRLRRHSSAGSDYFEDLARATLADVPEFSDLPAHVSLLMRRHLAEGEPSLAAVARELAMSSRTLQRRLATSGTSFAAVLDDVRREVAGRLLAVETDGTRLAQQLGYADATVLSRAMRRWFGKPRRALINSPRARPIKPRQGP